MNADRHQCVQLLRFALQPCSKRQYEEHMKLFLRLPRVQKQMIAAATDLILLPSTFCLAIYLRYDALDMGLLRQYFWILVAIPIVSIPIFIRIGMYRAVIRFINQRIVQIAIFGVTLSVLILAAMGAFATQMVGLSRGVFGIYWMTAIMYMVISRYLARAYFLRLGGHAGAKRVCIYGAGHAGLQLASALRSGQEYAPVAFVDDKSELHGATIAGIKIHSPNDLPNLIDKLRIQEILLAMPSLPKARQKTILDRLEPLKVKIQVTSSMAGLFTGNLAFKNMREIEIEDLLGRDPVLARPDLISRCIAGKTVMVTGAGGSIGSELCRQIIALRPAMLILLDVSEFLLYTIEQELHQLKKKFKYEAPILPFLGSVLDSEKCKLIMSTFSVETVYHAAAYKHVPLVEHNPVEGVCNNVFGTLSIARAALETDVKWFVLISTDKAVRPTNVMGATKRLAELILQGLAKQKSNTHFCMVRFGNVLGSSGSVVPLFREQISAGGPITITHPEITRYFMTIPEAAQLVLQAGAMGIGGDVFVLDMGEPIKILDLAKRMVHLSGLEIKSESAPEGTIEIQQVGLRPGEKLFEELLIGSNAEGTEHPLILRAQEADIPWSELQVYLERLKVACNTFNYEEIRNLLQLTVKEYTPHCEIEDLIWRHKKFLPKSKLPQFSKVKNIMP